MQTRALRRILIALLSTAPGCAVTTASQPLDAGRDAPPADLPSLDATDVPDAAATPDVVDAADVVDVPPNNCGMCGCDFTGRLEGTGPILAEHCRREVADGGSDGEGGVDASAVDPTTCAIQCDRACGGVTVSGSGLSRPWGLGTIGGGSPQTCERADTVTVRCVAYVPCGRRTEGQHDLAEDDSFGGYLRRAAWLEAQAEGAFTRLSAELSAHDAPSSLVRAARRSARDEARHAARMRAVCATHGLRSVPTPEAPRSVRSLADIAVENATEGCAGETWGALLAMHQATAARDPDVRAAMSDIARDEVCHAALSWAVHHWALKRLDGEGRARAELALEVAWDALERTVTHDPPAHLARPLGLPDAATATRLARALRSSLQPDCPGGI